MSLINLRERTINAKIVFYGTALSGKTTSLKHVHRVMDPDRRTELVSLNTEGDRTLFFDFLPISLGKLSGFQVKLQLFTVPGQVKYNLTRRYVLRGADAVIFVADSHRTALDGNVASLVSLGENLEANSLDPARIPLLIQYNKRDLPDRVSVEQLRSLLNREAHPEVEAVATTGEGVFEGFSALACEMMHRLAVEYRIGEPTMLRQVLLERLLDLQERYAASSPRRPTRPAPSTAPITGSLTVTDLMDTAEAHVPHSVIVSGGAAATDEGEHGVEELLERAVETQIESARMVTELAETRRRLADHVHHLAALHETGVLISSELDPDRLISRILEQALKAVGTAHGSILLLAREGTQLVEKKVRGFFRDPLASNGQVESRVLAGVLGRTPFLLDTEEHPDVLPRPAVPGAGPVQALVAPLVHQGEVLGALTAYLLDRSQDFDAQLRLRFLAAVAAQASVALENARLYAQVGSFNRELERMVEERTRELARAYEELKVLDGLKDDFLHSMSHELLTPLTSISSFAEILNEVAADAGASEERVEFAGIIHREALRLTSMLQDVLDLSRLEAGKVEMVHRPLDMTEQVKSAARRLVSVSREREVQFRIDTDADLPKVPADRRWIGRVLDALLGNAVKFSPPGARVTIEMRAIHDVLVVEVHDTGPGVPEGLRATIFEKFKQLGDVMTDKPTGLGLGLPMARQIIAQLGGRIWHEPGAGGGSTFAFSLPATRDAGAAAASADSSALRA